MEKEIADLRRRLADPSHEQQMADTHAGENSSPCSADAFSGRDSVAGVDRSRPVSVPVEPQPSIATPLTMQRDGSILSQEENSWRLEDISLSRTRVVRLYEQSVLILFFGMGTADLPHQILYILPPFSATLESS
jgi:hypothetical protein